MFFITRVEKFNDKFTILKTQKKIEQKKQLSFFFYTEKNADSGDSSFTLFCEILTHSLSIQKEMQTVETPSFFLFCEMLTICMVFFLSFVMFVFIHFFKIKHSIVTMESFLSLFF